ncbi:hypothetical protein [Mycolicibacterium smegmatis]|uniref:hypothetical protein n=1 Tax=Mycolicibacterium smegmatis TaxID=1772 RepID=UPI001303F2A1|nr:hypothetical protein [Mycolicibacterium smegmatis]
MAVRPLVTTGAALISAGALVAATPALFVPNEEVKIASVAPAAGTQTMTVEQLKLLASLQQISDAFFQGFGGKVTGDPENPNNCAEDDDAVCPAGFVGVPYLLIDEALGPNVLVDNYFFETGFIGTAQYILGDAGVPEEVLALIFDPVGTIQALVVGGVNTAFPDTFVAGITTAFLAEYGGNAGFVGAINYVVDAIIQGTVTPTPGGVVEDDEDQEDEGDQEQENQNFLKSGTKQDTTGDTGGLLGGLLGGLTVSGKSASALSQTLDTDPSSTSTGTGTLIDIDSAKPDSGKLENGTTLEKVEVVKGGEVGLDSSGDITESVGHTGDTTGGVPEPEGGEDETGGTAARSNTKPEAVTKDGNKFTPGVILSPGGRKSSSANGWEKLEQDVKKGINTLGKIFNKGKTSKPATSSTTDNAGEGGEGGGDE